MMYDLILHGGTLVDPLNGLHGKFDLAIAGTEIAVVAEHIPPASAKRSIEVHGKHVIPGIIDTHVHVCRPFKRSFQGFKMLARVGVTTALDMAGYPDMIKEGLESSGCGISMAYVHPILPGETVPDTDPDSATLEELCERALREGAIGIKILGGHYPITPDATAEAIRVASELGAYTAVHAGTTLTGSNINGVSELLQLRAGHSLHLAHVNSYCRGQVTGDPLVEAAHVLSELRATSDVSSESYLGLTNGAFAECVDGAPVSNVVKTCLTSGGYDATRSGMEKAIHDGWGQVHQLIDGETRLLEASEGVQHFNEKGSKVGISFPVNSPAAAIAIAVDRTERFGGDFTVDAISTDGGAYPRNTIVAQGLPLVRFGALSLEDFVRKTSINPSRMLGLPRKAHLGVGSDADITVLDLDSGHPFLSIARGQLIMHEGTVIGRGGHLITAQETSEYLRMEASSPAMPHLR